MELLLFYYQPSHPFVRCLTSPEWVYIVLPIQSPSLTAVAVYCYGALAYGILWRVKASLKTKPG